MAGTVSPVSPEFFTPSQSHGEVLRCGSLASSPGSGILVVPPPPEGGLEQFFLVRGEEVVGPSSAQHLEGDIVSGKN